MSELKETETGIDEVFPFIEGEIIDLVAGNSNWAKLHCKWNNAPNVRHYARNLWPITLEEVKKWFDPSVEGRTRDFVVFTIYHKAEERPIGTIGFGRIRWVDRRASISGVIGEVDLWGRGIMLEAAKLLVEYGFRELNLHKINAELLSSDKRSLRVAEKLGFKKEAVFKEQMYVDGQYQDIEKLSLFKRDWLKLNTL
ncbi:MAG: N-acetyltransferase [Candidatus Lokiarchaeota archaeon]|nr:N-acetyltransferase [Candidatus Lokiarchaeota archaeon]